MKKVRLKSDNILNEKILLPTPTANDWKGRQPTDTWDGNSDLGSIISKNFTPGSVAELSPEFILEMMGFPKDWTALPFFKKQDK